MLSERADGAPKGHPFPPARPIPYKGQGKRKEFLMNQLSLRYRQLKKTPEKDLLDILVATMAIPVLPWRHRHSAPAATPGRFTEEGDLDALPRISMGWIRSFWLQKTGPALFAPGLFHVKQFLVSEMEGQ
jgi:hypothetical protein